ncbi:MAG: prepilin-type N-terminal cleavage/methylation domain-containing protein [Elusimicrobiaceae bacterium]|nr:prepilin-type N-terminal cleavage/methylation domain-containing protein [Elusimicrobiaceae bacterium]
MKGFTLIELLVVVLIIGILSAVALPQYQKAVDKAQFMEMLTGCKKLSQAIELFYMSSGEYPQYWTDLDIEIQGCEASTTQWYDLYCKHYLVDLNPADFYAADGGSKESRAGKRFGCYYIFSTKVLSCEGLDGRGKAAMKSICGKNPCTF